MTIPQASTSVASSRRHHLAGTALLAVLVALPVNAQDAPSDEAESAEEVARIDEAVLLPSLNMAGAADGSVVSTNDTSATATVTRSEIDQRPSGFILNDVIRRLPGVYTGGGPGEDKDLRFRGLDKEYSRLQVDGIMLPGGGEKREFNLDILPNALIGSVTVIRNPSAEFEADGLTGRVHVETRAIPEDQQIDADFALGGTSFGSTAGGGGSFAYGDRFGDNFGLQGAISFTREPQLKVKSAFNAAGLLTSREEEDRPNERLALDLDAGFFWHGGQFHIRPQYFSAPDDKEKEKFLFRVVSGASVPNGSEREDEEKDRETYGLRFTLDQTLGESSALEASLGYFLTTEDKDKTKAIFAANGTENLARRETELEDKEDGFWQGDLRLSHDWGMGDLNHLLTGATIRLRERERDKEKTVGGVLQTLSAKENYFLGEDYFAGFVQNTFDLGSGLTLLPGLRGEYVALTSRDGRGVSDSSNDFQLIPSTSLTWRPAEGLSFHGAVSRSITRPKFDELSPFAVETGTDRLVIGNPDLEPTRAWAFDLGGEYRSELLTLSANVFHREISDVIETRATGEVIGGRRVEQVQNVGNGWLRGLELEQRLSLAPTGVPFIEGFTLTANQSFLDSELRSYSGTVAPFKEQPDFFGNFILDWEDTGLGTSVSAAASYVSRIENSTNGDGRGSEFFLDLQVSQRIIPGIEAYFRATNLTEQARDKIKADGSFELEEASSYYYVGLRARF